MTNWIWLWAFLASLNVGDYAGIRGVVKSNLGSPLSDASILLIPSTVPRIHPRRDGSFEIQPLKPGTYTVVVLHHEHSPWAFDDMVLKASQIATLDVSLEPSKDIPSVSYAWPSQKELEAESMFLTELGERAVCSPRDLPAGTESYRLIWSRHDHNLVLVEVRIDQVGGGVVTYKEMGEEGSWIYDETASAREKLRDYEWINEFMLLIRERAVTEFWALPYRIDYPNLIFIHGSTWAIEGYKDGKCHVVTRRSPREGDPLREFGETLLGLSDRRFYYDEFY